MADYNLDYLLTQVRRIEEHRESGAEAKIRTTYQKILKELRHYLADTYSQYAEDDKLTYDILQRHGRYAKFLDEVEKKINDLSPETKRLIRSVVEQTYEHTYNGMIEAVKDTTNDVVSGLKGCTPAIIRRAVENPVSKLTLNDRLEKHRKEIIYDIKQAITVGLVNGDRYSTMANRIKQSVDGSYKKAIRISRTETHRVREAGNLDAAESVQTALNTGDVPLQMMKVWKTMKDERVRPAKAKGKNKQYDHRKMDGVAVKIDEMFTLPSGAKTMAPGQSGVAGEDINCRCYLSYEVIQVAKTITPEEVAENDQIELLKKYGNLTNIMLEGTSDDLTKWSELQKISGKTEKELLPKMSKSADNWETVLKMQSEATMKPFVNQLLEVATDTELGALRTWSGGSYININRYLRYGVNVDPISKKAAKNVEAVLNKVTTPKEIIVSRGTGTREIFEKMTGDWEKDPSVLVGQKFSDKGFTATSPIVGGGFSGAGKGNAKLFIRVPRGTHGAYIAHEAFNEEEKEFLLQRGYSYRIIKAEYRQNPRYKEDKDLKVWCEVILNE